MGHISSDCFLKYQAETSEDLFEWKATLEQALAQAPGATLFMGRNGIFRNDASDHSNSVKISKGLSINVCVHIFAKICVVLTRRDKRPII